MALRWIEGFEVRQHSGYLGRLYTYVGASVSSATTGRKHGTAWSSTNSVFTTPALVGAVENVWIIHFACRKPTNSAYSSSVPGLALFDSVGSQLELRAVDPASPDAGNFQLQLMRGATVLATSPVYSWGAGNHGWHVFQLKVTIDPSAGTYELRHYDYDGTETTAIAAATGANTANQGTAGADRVRFSSGSGGSSAQLILDDIVVMDGTGSTNNDFLAAPIVVLGELPNGDGATTDFLPSSGVTNFSNVDDSAITPDETTEVTSSTIGDVDLYDFSGADLALLPTASPPTVLGVMVDVEGSMKNSGTANLAVEVRDGADQATDTKLLPFSGSAKVSRFTVMEENPTGTPAPWTTADLATIQLGIRYDS